MEVIEICLYLFPQGTQKWAEVLMIHHQNRRAARHNLSFSMRALCYKIKAALLYSPQYRGEKQYLYFTAVSRNCGQVKDMPWIVRHLGWDTQCHHHCIILLHLHHAYKETGSETQNPSFQTPRFQAHTLNTHQYICQVRPIVSPLLLEL